MLLYLCPIETYRKFTRYQYTHYWDWISINILLHLDYFYFQRNKTLQMQRQSHFPPFSSSAPTQRYLSWNRYHQTQICFILPLGKLPKYLVLYLILNIFHLQDYVLRLIHIDTLKFSLFIFTLCFLLAQTAMYWYFSIPLLSDI